MNQGAEKLARLLERADPGWSDDELDQLTLLLTSTLSDAAGTALEPLNYDDIEHSSAQRTADFLWVRFRSRTFTPEILVLVGGAVHASRRERRAAGFLQYFIDTAPVRATGGRMLVMSFSKPTTGAPVWSFTWEPHDFVEEYDQYSFSYFQALSQITAPAHPSTES